MKDNKVSLFFETSSKTSENVNSAFEEVTKQLFLNKLTRTKTVITSQHVENIVNLQEKSADHNKKCCN